MMVIVDEDEDDDKIMVQGVVEIMFNLEADILENSTKSGRRPEQSKKKGKTHKFNLKKK